VSCETAETTEFRPTEGWQNEPKYLCPDCRQTMEKYGYMGIAAIQIDRCDPDRPLRSVRAGMARRRRVAEHGVGAGEKQLSHGE
jgi:hypothetical protein